ncbi:hypothetical protein KFE25_008175 [Diacronema lutheri]|uniref:Uncharacterized protein n=1 Tax=Diacronema lutheri TaxID=2081491 RepID=A0A8J5XDN6_DIALT|nr:hypothetical protein KFE25_008175 [Diacronema lutheri]
MARPQRHVLLLVHGDDASLAATRRALEMPCRPSELALPVLVGVHACARPFAPRRSGWQPAATASRALLEPPLAESGAAPAPGECADGERVALCEDLRTHALQLVRELPARRQAVLDVIWLASAAHELPDPESDAGCACYEALLALVARAPAARLHLVCDDPGGSRAARWAALVPLRARLPTAAYERALREALNPALCFRASVGVARNPTASAAPAGAADGASHALPELVFADAEAEEWVEAEEAACARAADARLAPPAARAESGGDTRPKSAQVDLGAAATDAIVHRGARGPGCAQLLHGALEGGGVELSLEAVCASGGRALPHHLLHAARMRVRCAPLGARADGVDGADGALRAWWEGWWSAGRGDSEADAIASAGAGPSTAGTDEQPLVDTAASRSDGAASSGDHAHATARPTCCWLLVRASTRAGGEGGVGGAAPLDAACTFLLLYHEPLASTTAAAADGDGDGDGGAARGAARGAVCARWMRSAAQLSSLARALGECATAHAPLSATTCVAAPTCGTNRVRSSATSARVRLALSSKIAARLPRLPRDSLGACHRLAHGARAAAEHARASSTCADGGGGESPALDSPASPALDSPVCRRLPRARALARGTTDNTADDAAGAALDALNAAVRALRDAHDASISAQLDARLTELLRLAPHAECEDGVPARAARPAASSARGLAGDAQLERPPKRARSAERGVDARRAGAAAEARHAAVEAARAARAARKRAFARATAEREGVGALGGDGARADARADVCTAAAAATGAGSCSRSAMGPQPGRGRAHAMVLASAPPWAPLSRPVSPISTAAMLAPRARSPCADAADAGGARAAGGPQRLRPAARDAAHGEVRGACSPRASRRAGTAQPLALMPPARALVAQQPTPLALAAPAEASVGDAPCLRAPGARAHEIDGVDGHASGSAGDSSSRALKQLVKRHAKQALAARSAEGSARARAYELLIKSGYDFAKLKLWPALPAHGDAPAVGDGTGDAPSWRDEADRMMQAFMEANAPLYA